jgi:trans-aconitate methyltransferase
VIADTFAGRELNPEARAYLAYHARRYAFLQEVVAGELERQGNPPGARILDVGPNFQTELLVRRLPGAVVDTLGFAHPLFGPQGDGARHVELDLNETGAAGAPTGDGAHQVVVLAEVIEHLHVPPAAVLGHLASWLAPRGALIVQTPNAVALHKRLRMLAGRSPWEPIRSSRTNPGHFHEYTVPELRDAAREAGLAVTGCRVENYFDRGSFLARAYNVAARALPASLRHGITMTLER